MATKQQGPVTAQFTAMKLKSITTMFAEKFQGTAESAAKKRNLKWVNFVVPGVAYNSKNVQFMFLALFTPQMKHQEKCGHFYGPDI